MPSSKVECPGCGGEKTKQAKLCSKCRREAIAVGVNAVTDRRGAPPAERMITQGKSDAYHAKANELADYLGQSVEDVKQRTLAWASTTFGRQITSSKQLTSREASLVLDHLADQIRATKSALKGVT